ncbi:MAG TPA: hypothetical protein DCE42_00160 [Myxococcales bacterium]|nr:hypothetical protein [Deltaproteobacteria bacterium]HAA53133.1 hypothetical protein [Myxococcales bacterium]|tara:strand:- start:159 stop:524 length:366 start_codon:yes stop_codon:yes gene_type:complete
MQVYLSNTTRVSFLLIIGWFLVSLVACGMPAPSTNSQSLTISKTSTKTVSTTDTQDKADTNDQNTEPGDIGDDTNRTWCNCNGMTGNGGNYESCAGNLNNAGCNTCCQNLGWSGGQRKHQM